MGFHSTASLPYPAPHAAVSVAAVQAGDVAAAVCTLDGNLSVWPNVGTSSGLLQARISQEVTCMVSIILPSQIFIIICGTADGRLYRVDCVAQAHAAQNQALCVIPLQQAKTSLMGSLTNFWESRVASVAKNAIHALQVILYEKSLKILALTNASLECWQMAMPPGSTAQLLWSHPVLSIMQKQAQATAQLSLCSLSAVSMKGSRHNVAVLASAPGGTLALQLLSMSQTSKPEELSTHILDVTKAESTAESATEERAKWRCCCGQKLQVLIWKESGSAYRWTVETGLVRQVLDETVLSATVAANAKSPHWLILTSSKVVQVAMDQVQPAHSVAVTAQPPAASRRPAVSQALSHLTGSSQAKPSGTPQAVPQDEVFQLLQTAVYTPAQDPARQPSIQQLARMVPRLQEPPGAANIIAVFSARVIDVLPKQWGRALAADYLQQLCDKEDFHQTFLNTLEEIDVIRVLDPDALRVLFESAEKLEAVSAVREYENEQREDGQMERMTLLQDVIFDAGRLCAAPVSAPVEQRSEQEIFYSCPSTSAEAFFGAVSVQLAGLETSAYADTASTQLEQALEVAQAVQNVLNKTHARHQELIQAYQRDMFRVSTDTPWWSAGLTVRTALQALADTLARLAQLLQGGDPAHFEKSIKWLLTMTETVLVSFTQAMDSCQAAATLQALNQDYEQARHKYLQLLLDIAQSLGEEGGGTLLVQRVEELADAHRAYAQLFEVCQLQGDDFKPHSIMMRHRATTSGNHLDLEQSAVAYVFDRLFTDGEHERLLSFPDHFKQDLTQWLQKRLASVGSNRTRATSLRRLTWLHELRRKDYAAASRTLADVTNNNEGDSATVHRAACIAKLTKLAAVKGPILMPSQEDVDYVNHAHTKIIMLQVQEALGMGSEVVHPLSHLLTACLSDETPPSQVCYVFLLLGHLRPIDRQQAYRKEFQEAWLKLAAATDWKLVAQHSQQLSDDQISSFLRQTDLCNAAQTCYHSQDCNVREVFPPEGVMGFVVDQAAAGLDAAAKQLMQGAFARGVHGLYVQPLQDEANMGSPTNMQAD
ncbi:hypothetical protein WJX77_011844 [Trebouxia sp. C0004]